MLTADGQSVTNMININDIIYYINQEYNVKKGIYKGEIYSLPPKEITNIYSEEEGNILINSDYVFSTKQEAIEFLI